MFYSTCVITSPSSNHLAFSLSALFSYLNLWSSLRVWITVAPPKECPITAILSLSMESYVKEAWYKYISISKAVQRTGRDFVTHKIIISQAWLSTLILGKEIYTHSHAPTYPYIHAYRHTYTHTYVHIHTCLYIYKHFYTKTNVLYIYIHLFIKHIYIYKTYIYKFYLYIERNFFGFRTKTKTSKNLK